VRKPSAWIDEVGTKVLGIMMCFGLFLGAIPWVAKVVIWFVKYLAVYYNWVMG
jgi:hypothetical protein